MNQVVIAPYHSNICIYIWYLIDITYYLKYWHHLATTVDIYLSVCTAIKLLIVVMLQQQDFSNA